MNRIFSALILSLAFSFSGFAQDKAQIKKGFIQYQALLKSGEYEKSMDYVYPGLFQVVPRAQMTQAMKSMLNNPMMEIELGKVENLEVADSKKVEDEYFAVMSYSTNMSFKMNANSPEEKAAMTAQLKANFEQKYGAENVTYDKESGFFSVKMTERAVAISPNNKDSWTYLNLQEGQEQIMMKILPPEIAKSL